MSPPDPAFGPFQLELSSGRLLRDGQTLPIGQRGFALLCALHAAKGAPVAKDSLLAAAWPGLAVEEGNLTVQIATLRRVLGPGPDGQDWIVTVPRLGYRLAMPTAADVAGVPRLAVLPFAGDGDPTGDWFAAGIADDLIAALGRFRSFAVLSRDAARGRAGSSRDIAATLAADYLLSGSARRAGNRLRLVTELVDGATGQILWAERFDGEADRIFDAQDRIVARTATTVEPRIARAELDRSLRRPATTRGAHDFYLRALALLHRETEPANREADALLGQALALSPDHALYLARASWALEHRITMAWPPLGADDHARCLDLATRAEALAEGDPVVLAHCALSFLQVGRDYDRGLALADAAAEANPHCVIALMAQAVCRLHAADPASVLAPLARVLDLSPGDPLSHIAHCARADAFFLTGDIPAALDEARRALAVNPSFDASHWILAASLAASGRDAEARAAVTRLRQLSPGTTVARIRAAQPSRFPDRTERLVAALRQAGLPEG